ncbi:MAG: helix-turn-helix domain-containing protein [Pseudomonadota bacterium]
MSSEDNKKGSKKNKMPRYLLPNEAAEYLRVKASTMANWRWKGVGPKYRKHGGTVVYPFDEIERYSGDDGKSHVG